MKARRKVLQTLFVLAITLLMAITTVSINTNKVTASGEYSMEWFYGLGKSHGTSNTNTSIFTGSGAMLNNDTGYSIKGYRDTAYANGPSSGMGNRYDNTYTGIKSVDIWYNDTKATVSPTGTVYYTSAGQMSSSSSGNTKLTTFAKSGSSLCTRWFAIPGEIDCVVHYTSGEHTISVNNIEDASFDNDLGEKYDKYYTTKTVDSTSTIVSGDYTNASGIVQDIILSGTNAVGNVVVVIGSDEIACNNPTGIQYLSSSYTFSDEHASSDILAIDFVNNQIKYYKVNTNISLTYNYATDTTFDVTFMVGDDVYDNQEVYEGYLASKPADPELPDGYNAFLGWYLGEEEYNFSSKVNSDLTLQARFALLDEFTITFMKGENIYEEQIVLDGFTATKPSDPTVPSGYDVFLGWILEDGSLFDFSTIIDQNITLYAKFDVYHTVTFKNLGHDYTSSNGSLLKANFVASGSWASATGGSFDFHNCVGTTVGDYVSTEGLALNGYTLLYDFEKLTMKFGSHQVLTIEGLDNLRGKTYFVDANYELVERADYQEGDVFKITASATTNSTINTRFYKIVENIEFEVFYSNYHTIRILNFGNGTHGSIGVGKFAASGSDYAFYAWDPYGSTYGGGSNLRNGGTIDYNAGIATIYGDYSSTSGYGAALLVYEDYEKHNKITFTYGENTISYELDNTKYTNETWYVDGIKVLVFVQNTGASYYNLRFYNVSDDITVKTTKDIENTVTADVTLNNDGTLTEKVYVQIPDYKQGYSVTIDGQETNVSLIDSSTFKYQINTPAKVPSKISEPFVIRIVDETGEELFSKTTSLKEYLYALFDSENSSTEMKNLAKSMLNYGAYCQLYFGETDDGLANEDLFLDDQEVDDVVVKPVNDRAISGSTDGASFYGQSLNLISATKLCVYFQIDGDVSEYEFEDGANVLTPSKYSDGVYYVSIRNVAAPDLGVKHAFTVTKDGQGSLTVTASVLSYANVVINKYENATDEEHINLVKAMKALYAYEAAATSAGILPTVSSLLYTNKTVESVKLGDPFIVYDDRENGTGKFYCYGTTGQVGAKGFYAYESDDLENWGNPKIVFRRDDTTWCQSTLWAPEVIYDEETELYYMFYSAKWEAADEDNPGEDEYYYLYGSVATCSEPNGTFVEYSSETKSTYEPLICFEKHNDEVPAALRSTLSGINGQTGFIKIIDLSPFVDPVTGKKYLFFVADSNTPYVYGSFVFGMEMEDWVTPKYETLTKITKIGYTTTAGLELISEGQRINEGPSVYYHDGTYYLTFSTYSYKNVKYQVRQALASSPLGPYTKIQPADGGTVISTVDYMISQSAGHSSFLQLGDELYIVYHAFYNDTDVDDGRRIAVDKLVFVENDKGQEVLKAAGPTTTPQPKPEILTGYKNLASDASFSANVSGGNLGYLKDGFLPLDESGYEYTVASGKVTITITLDTYREVRGLLIYNARDDVNRFSSVASVSISGLNETVTFNDLVYDNSEYSRNSKEALDAALILSLNEKGVSTITITFDEDSQIAIPEIIVLGK